MKTNKVSLFFLLSMCLILVSCTDENPVFDGDYDYNAGEISVGNNTYTLDKAFFICEKNEVSENLYKCRLELYSGDVIYSTSQQTAIFNDIDNINSVVFEITTFDNEVLRTGEYATTNVEFTNYQLVEVTAGNDIFGIGETFFSEQNAILDVLSADENSADVKFDIIDDDNGQTLSGTYTGQYEYYLKN